MREEAIVVGGGTAGLIAAKNLASSGVATTVYDQKKVLGVPARASGILSLSGLESLGIDYKDAITNTLNGALIHAGDQTMRVDAKTPIALVLDRIKLNAMCMEQAEAHGARVVLGKRLETTPNQGKIIIGADGAISGVASRFKMGSIARHSLTYKATFKVRCDAETVELFFDNKVTPGLFGWLCPNSDHELEVGIGIDSDKGNAKRAFELFMKNKRVSESIGNSKVIEEHASMIPMCLREKIVDEQNKVLLVGDAAGQVKPSTGGGIIFGGNASILAAKTVVKHIETGSPLQSYEKEYRRKYGMDTFTHAIVNKFYSGVDVQTMAFAISLLKAVRMDGFLAKFGDMDMPSRMLKNVFFGRPTYGQE